MPGTARDLQEAKDRLHAFLAEPDAVGLYLHLEDARVDLTVHVVGERVGAYAWRCASCGHLARRGTPPRVLVPTGCPLCYAPAPSEIPFRGDLMFRTYAWTIRWPKEGKAGWGLGRVIDEGRFSDASIAAGLSRVETCVSRDVPTLEAQGIVTVRDLHAILRMGPQEPVGVALKP